MTTIQYQIVSYDDAPLWRRLWKGQERTPIGYNWRVVDENGKVVSDTPKNWTQKVLFGRKLHYGNWEERKELPTCRV